MRRFDTAHRIVEQVARMYELDPADIFSADRHRTQATARQMCFLLLRHITPLSFPEIGRVMLRDHSTVMHGYRRTLRVMMNEDREFDHGVYRTVMAMFQAGGPSLVKCPGGGVEFGEAAAE